ncbi:hypothetical protein ACSX1A_13070 [Pontibacter sp. MBLB2868]|uniref:hypothetical protein n=1 Tax=Pontibacter sp. MBLB2868 TaxID=3451555 RepID=UPI003F75529E
MTEIIFKADATHLTGRLGWRILCLLMHWQRRVAHGLQLPKQVNENRNTDLNFWTNIHKQ